MEAEGKHVQGKVVLVTGAGGGFGRLVSQKTAALGASVVATDVDEAGLEQTVDLISASGGKVTGMRADVTVKSDLDEAVRRAVDTFGTVDVLVNNAGIMPLAFFADHAQAWEAWDRAIDINVKGIVHGIAAVHDQMINQGRGHVINISSIYGNGGVAGSGVYSATKAAVGVISDSLRVESQGKIKVTVVRPTGVPGTGLGAGVINVEALVGITGQNLEAFNSSLMEYFAGSLSGGGDDLNDVSYWTLSPEDLADQIVAVIDTPWGLDISDITVRATGENYVL